MQRMFTDDQKQKQTKKKPSIRVGKIGQVSTPQ